MIYTQTLRPRYRFLLPLVETRLVWDGQVQTTHLGQLEIRTGIFTAMVDTDEGIMTLRFIRTSGMFFPVEGRVDRDSILGAYRQVGHL